jgi:hypothetical protein
MRFRQKSALTDAPMKLFGSFSVITSALSLSPHAMFVNNANVEWFMVMITITK